MTLVSWLRDVVLPFLITLVGGFFVIQLDKRGRKFQWMVVIAMTLSIGVVMWLQWLRTPKMVIVPVLLHEFTDPAVDLCEQIGLKPTVKEGNYGGRPGEIIRQSLYPGSRVYVGREIELTVYRGSPVGDDILYDSRPSQGAK